MERSAAYIRVQRELNNMAGFIRRKGITGWVKDRSAAPYYRDILAQLVALEDSEGVEYVVKLSDRFRALYWEALDRGLLTHREMVEVDRQVFANG